MSVLLSVQKAGVSIPEFEVSTGAAGHKHLGTWREAASHDAGLSYGGTSARGGGEGDVGTNLSVTRFRLQGLSGSV